MPGRIPHAFKKDGSRRGTSRREPTSTFMTELGFGPSRNLLKTRVIQSGLFHIASGGLLLILAIVADSQYGYSRRFGKAFVGVSLVAITFTKALLELFLAIYVGCIWYLSLIMDACFFNIYAFLAVVETIISFWAVIVCISSLLTDGSGGASVSYSSGQRTMLIFMVLVLCASALLSLAFTVGSVRMRKEQAFQRRHAPAAFSSVVVAKHKTESAGDRKAPDSDSDTETDSDDNDGPPQAPARHVALPTPGAAGSQPVFYQQASAPPPPVPGKAPARGVPAGAGVGAGAPVVPPPERPVHDETTRALFAHMWQSMKEVGNFACGVSRVPGLPELVEHLRKHGFLPLMTGDNGAERKLYFYAEETGEDGSRVMVFLAEFKFDVPSKRLDATFKSHTKTHIQQVRKFNLQELFQVVKVG